VILTFPPTLFSPNIGALLVLVSVLALVVSEIHRHPTLDNLSAPNNRFVPPN
jgi:hypothetical protein